MPAEPPTSGSNLFWFPDFVLAYRNGKVLSIPTRTLLLPSNEDVEQVIADRWVRLVPFEMVLASSGSFEVRKLHWADEDYWIEIPTDIGRFLMLVERAGWDGHPTVHPFSAGDLAGPWYAYPRVGLNTETNLIHADWPEVQVPALTPLDRAIISRVTDLAVDAVKAVSELIRRGELSLR